MTRLLLFVVLFCALPCPSLRAQGPLPFAGEAPPVPAAALAPPAPLVALAQLRDDANADGVYDRLGQRVRVRGVVSVGQGELHSTPRLDLYLQDDTGGVRLVGGAAQAIPAGTPLDAVGEVSAVAGDLALRVEHLRVDGLAVDPPSPLRLDRPEGLDAYLGRLVTLRGYAASQGDVPVGYTLGVLVGDTLVYAVRFFDAPLAQPFPRFWPGQAVEVTGVLGRFRSAYQVYPRSAADVQAVGMRPTVYRLLALLAAGLLLVALAWAVHLVRVGRMRLAAHETSQRQFQLLFDKSETGVVVMKRAPEGGVEVVRANPAAYAILGLDPSGDFRLEGYRFLPAQQPFSTDEMALHLEALRQDGRDRRMVRMHWRDGQERAVMLDSIKVMQEGESMTFSFLEDITERVAREQALVDAREKAEAFARMQSTFLRNMSHELRTPLAGIIGFSEVLRDELEGDPRQFAIYIEEAGRRLLGTLQDVLDLSRFSSGNTWLDPQPLDLAALLHAVAETQRPRAEQGCLVLRVSAPDTLPVVQDAKAVQRILEHLLANAFKFTPDGGTVTLCAEATGYGTVRLVVEDTGIGMSEDFQKHVFTRYAQESSGYARSHEGVGLGLNLVRALLDQMQGTIRIDSARGVGTSVTVELPLAPETAVTATATAGGASA